MLGTSLVKSLWFYTFLRMFTDYYSSYDVTQDVGSMERVGIGRVYDFVVVGAGTAGSVVSNRLTESDDVNVLLLEAGGPETEHLNIPAVAAYLQLTEVDWQFQAAPSSTSCLAMVDNSCNLPRGKVLGGSSSINYMIYVRGNQKDYDQWEAFGNKGWNFKSVLPYFKKSEDNQNKLLTEESMYHSVGGYQKISEGSWHTLLAKAFLAAGIELDYPTIDINGPSQTGFTIPQGFYYRGSRQSASKSFLRPIMDRPNLNIKINSEVTKILLDSNNVAYGVEFMHGGIKQSVNATKEVILSAGAFGSPKLLMMSGIGPASHLKSVGIEPKMDLPVGRNLQDHVAGILHFSINPGLSLTAARMESLSSVYKYVLWDRGPLTTFGGIEGIGFAHTKYSNRSEDWPDIEFHFISGSPASDEGHLVKTLNLRQEYWDNYFSDLSEGDSYSIVVKLLRPKSRGYIELKSKNSEEHPKIVMNYFSEPFDSIVLIDGLKIAKAIGETAALKAFGSKFYARPVPGCEGHRIKSDRYWECFIRHLSLTIYHYSGTAKMGPYWDSDAVVDSKLRVYGISGLRVIDASIFPTIPNGNTNAAVMMVAEKVSDDIKRYWERDIRVIERSDAETIPQNQTTEKITETQPDLITRLSDSFNFNMSNSTNEIGHLVSAKVKRSLFSHLLSVLKTNSPKLSVVNITENIASVTNRALNFDKVIKPTKTTNSTNSIFASFIGLKFRNFFNILSNPKSTTETSIGISEMVNHSTIGTLSESSHSSSVRLPMSSEYMKSEELTTNPKFKHILEANDRLREDEL